MCKKYIGFGNCSKIKSYKYILFAFLLKILNDNYFTFNSISPQNEIHLFGISSVLSKHNIIQHFYKYISYIIGGIIFKLIIRYNTKRRKNEKISNEDKKKSFFWSLTLIHYEKEKEKKPINQLLMISFFYSLFFEFVYLMILFKVNNLCFWPFEVIFLEFFMKKFFSIKFYNYQKCSLIFMITIISTFSIINSFLPVIDFNSISKNAYEILESLVNKNYFIFVLIFIIINLFHIFISYVRVRAKVLIDFKYISPYTIIIFIGIFGIILSTLELIFGHFFKCEGNFRDYCILESNNNKYLDDIQIYLQSLKNKKNDNEKSYEFYLEILLLLPIFLVTNFFELVCEFWIITHLIPVFVLIKNNFYYGINGIFFIIFNYNKFDNKRDILTQFFICEITEITSIICYMIYLQMIELRFCGLDNYLDRNLLLLSKLETEDDNSEIEEEQEQEEDIDKNREYSLFKTETIYN